MIAWNGTAGSWLGTAHDRAITDAITGRPVKMTETLRRQIGRAVGRALGEGIGELGEDETAPQPIPMLPGSAPLRAAPPGLPLQ